MKRAKTDHSAIIETLTQAGLRPTRQRILLGSLLFSGPCRHVSAEELHNEAGENGIHVALATVYNTLHQFTAAGLLHHIALEGGKSYFDTNVDEHHHFLNEDTGELMDIPAEHIRVTGIPAAPGGTKVQSVDVIVRVREAAY
jgi:Fur family iron response transcriptional regulator